MFRVLHVLQQTTRLYPSILQSIFTYDVATLLHKRQRLFARQLWNWFIFHCHNTLTAAIRVSKMTSHLICIFIKIVSRKRNRSITDDSQSSWMVEWAVLSRTEFWLLSQSFQDLACHQKWLCVYCRKSIWWNKRRLYLGAPLGSDDQYVSEKVLKWATELKLLSPLHLLNLMLPILLLHMVWLASGHTCPEPHQT